MKFNKSIISILMLFAILSTMTAAFAADQSWNDVTYTIPDGFSVGTPGVQKIGMMDGKQSVILEKLNESRLDELKEASKPVDEKTYKIEDTDVTETVFDTETGKLHFLKFAKDGQDFDLVYEEFIGEEEEPAEEADNATADNTTEDNATQDNATADNATEDANATEESSDDGFDATKEDSPANLIIRSLKIKG